VLIWKADSLQVEKRVKLQVDRYRRWVAFIDDDNLLYSLMLEKSRYGELWTTNITTGARRMVPIEGGLYWRDVLSLPQVLVVRGGKSLLIALRNPEYNLHNNYFQPVLVGIATGRVEPLQGLPENKRDIGPLGVLWEQGAVDRLGDLAVVSCLRESDLWPYPAIEGIYYWKDGSNRFKEYKPNLVQKSGPSLDSSGRKMLYAWAGTWYITDLSKEITE
jgi:hypothetical protein